jgi:hypothetical protein
MRFGIPAPDSQRKYQENSETEYAVLFTTKIAALHPLVAPGNPAYSAETFAEAHRARLRHRLVALASRP